MDRNIPFECIYVDLLTGEERSETLRELRRLNPEATFPTLVVGDKVIVGYKKEEIRQTLDESESQSQEAVRECRVLTQPKSGGG
jgi:glutaredoxin